MPIGNTDDDTVVYEPDTGTGGGTSTDTTTATQLIIAAEAATFVATGAALSGGLAGMPALCVTGGVFALVGLGLAEAARRSLVRRPDLERLEVCRVPDQAPHQQEELAPERAEAVTASLATLDNPLLAVSRRTGRCLPPNHCVDYPSLEPDKYVAFYRKPRLAAGAQCPITGIGVDEGLEWIGTVRYVGERYRVCYNAALMSPELFAKHGAVPLGVSPTGHTVATVPLDPNPHVDPVHIHIQGGSQEGTYEIRLLDNRLGGEEATL